jgi:L-glutamine-phosphate cytidylyltransferase
MQTLILNSGIGSRMGSLTEKMPKCLVEITEDDTILSRQVSALQKIGLKQIVITTGPYEEKIKKHLHKRFADLKFTFVNNQEYRNTNYIYSMLLTKGFIKEDLILMHGDMVFEDGVLEKLVYSGYKDAVLVNGSVELPEKDFKGVIREGRVRKIAVDVFSDDCAFLLPMYKLTIETMNRWFEEMELFREKNDLKVYAENALNNLLEDLNLKPVYINSKFCMEIDDIKDLELAKKYFADA